MPKLIPVEEKRVVLNCLISPRTRALLSEMDCSQGEAVDRWTAAWMMAQQQVKVGSAYSPAIEEKIRANVTPRPFKGPLLKPSQK